MILIKRTMFLQTVIFVFFHAVCANNDCWWTGCQSNDWEEKGCSQYNKTQVESKECENGLEYYCCEKKSSEIESPTPVEVQGCFWTDCHNKDFDVKGCEQYNRTQVEKKECEDGLEYYCCDRKSNEEQSKMLPQLKDCWWTGCQKNNLVTKGCQQFNKTQGNTKECESGLDYYCCEKISSEEQTMVLPDAEVCWWTGCQNKNWATKGCKQYNKTQIDTKECEDGLEYYCCDRKSNEEQSKMLPQLKDCWWTGCQKNNLVTKGCQQFNKTQGDTKECESGLDYYCCEKISSEEQTMVLPDAEVCWWTGCQNKNWAIKGCKQYNKTQIDTKECEDGLEYYCCDRKSNEEQSKMLPQLKDCWWTGCQKNNLVTKGCQQFNKTQGDTKECESGLDYYCCEKISSEEQTMVLPDAEVCWWTGCQNKNWAIKGCKQYNKTQIDTKECEDGLEYYCCDRKSNEEQSKMLPQLKDCWWTGCQKNNLVTKGCQQFNKTQGDTKECESGLDYYCCEKISSEEQTMVLPDAEVCWWTGCQNKNWAIKGCKQYNKTQIDTKECEDGLEYYCCDRKSNEEQSKMLPQLKDCWWTGCQKNNLVTKGCQQFNKTQGDTKECESGLDYYCCEKISSEEQTMVLPDAEVCWWTGCQNKNWAIKGCKQYNKTQIDTKECEDGLEYYCCDRKSNEEQSKMLPQLKDCWWTGCQKNNLVTKGCQQFNKTQGDTKECESGLDYYCCEKISSEERTMVLPDAEVCWWTGCQNKNWAIKGCKQYNKTQIDTKECEDGLEYYCCDRKSNEEQSKMLPQLKDCWWTGCQKNNLVTKGCQQFNKTQGDTKECESGLDYYCCEKISSEEQTMVLPDAEVCWWTGCQNKNWAIKGCKQYNKTQIDTKECEDGLEYYCCDRKSNEEQSKMLPQLKYCWWTGCQKNNLVTKGCQQFNKTQDDTKECESGLDYYCCEKISSEEQSMVLPDAEVCWWTGCQNKNWATKGCQQYNKTQVDTKECENGLEYYCCDKKSYKERSVMLPEVKDCWWTGCQSKNWVTKGCQQYNKTQVDTKECENGLEYYCCDKKSHKERSVMLPEVKDCWWTGCQSKNWVTKGCQQYNKTQVDTKECENGLEYYCCDKKSHNEQSVMLPEVKDCWWTGCQSKNWVTKGCQQYNRTQVDTKECENGLEYHCCENKSSEVQSATLAEAINMDNLTSCWWTGCQKTNWAVRGCGQYNRTQVGIKDCRDGSEYLCCEEKISFSSPSPTDSKDCWWTGCQLNSWAVIGCMQYNLTQQDVRNCEDGHEYYCCPEKAENESDLENSDDHMECWWSACQPTNWTERGCPSNMKKINSQNCGENEGDMFQCCVQKDQVEGEETELLSGDSFINFVKYLLFKGKNYTLQPDSLPCLAIDVAKQSLLKIKNEGIYLCDLCPNFPQKRLINVFLTTDPFDIISNILFPECFGYCFDKDDCVAFSYDYLESTCYIFNNTVGSFEADAKWTTVVMTQPVGLIGQWTYSRHTSIIGDVRQYSFENNFLACLKKCDENNICNYVSYSIKTLNCSMFSLEEEIKYIDLNYAHISAFKITSMPVGSDKSSRFIQEGDDIFVTSDLKKISNKNKCSSLKNETHSAFYSKSCLTSGNLGCDHVTGCKSCYYPENTNDYNNLVICPDSEWTILSEIKNIIQNALANCLELPSCIGVGYNSESQETHQLTFQDFVSNKYTTKFLLQFPTDNSGDHAIVTKYDFLPNYDIERVSDKSNSFLEMSSTNIKDCLRIFESNSNYIRMSYSNNKCKISSQEVKFISKNGNFLTVFKKTPITSPILNYARTPGFSIPHDKVKSTFGPCADINCEVICADKCNKEYSNWCTHFTLRQDINTATCYFFDFLSENSADATILQSSDNEQVFTKISSLDFSLDSLKKLNPFQTSDIYNCFQPDTETEQTQTSLTVYDINHHENTMSIRRKRGFFDFIKKAVKAVGTFVVDTVKDTVNTVVDTAKGVVNTVKNVVKGDLNKAKESFVNIPIVKDVKNAVDLGKAVVTGDWDTAKERGIDLLQSQTLDVATSLIPVGGKAIGKGLKTVGKEIKKRSSKVKNSAKKNIDKVNENNKKLNNDKSKTDKNNNNKGTDTNDRTNCKKRSKRAAANPKKRKKPGSCDDDDDDKTCQSPTIKDVIPVTLSGCRNNKKNAICEYECHPGFDEPDRRIKCVSDGNSSPSWTPKPVCNRVSCGTSPYPLIPVQTPHVTNFGSTEFGRFITAYVVLYQKLRKLPFWSVALHQSNQFRSKDYTALKDVKRSNTFKAYPCLELNSFQADKNDYLRSGWAQGHLTPANVARWSEKAKLSSNLFINVAPQDPFTNSGPWANLESHVECFSENRRTLVATGICNDHISRTKSRLEVPKCYWKMLCYKDENNNEQVVGFISGNTHPLTEDEKDERRAEVYNPVSQREVKKLLQGINGAVRSPWIHTAARINQGRPIQSGFDATVWFPINPFDCEKADDLSQEEKDAWSDRFPKILNKVSTGKTKRSTKPPLKRGCHSNSQLRNMKALLGIHTDDDDKEIDEGSSSSDADNSGSALTNVQNCNKRIIGYYTSWGNKQIGVRELRRLTHVIYAFLEMRSDGSVDVGSADRKNSENVDKETKKSKERLEKLMQIASLNPHVKVMFAVGGWENSQYFSSVAANPEKRIIFIASIVKLIQRYGFDGVDIDWEYPVTGGANEGIPQDKQNYVLLMKEIRTALDNLASEANRKQKFLLSFAGAAGQWTIDPGYDLPGLLKYADFVNIMTYDYFGAWASKWGAYTGPPSPLHFGMPPRFSGKTNADWTVKYYTCKTKLPHKINMGVPFYGRYWKNVGPPVDGKDGMWRTAQRVNGIFEGGYVPWNEIHSKYLSDGGFEQHFHKKSKTPYAWNPGSKTFLGYEDKKSLEFKVDYAIKHNVGGLMIWAVELDDDDLTLLNTISKASLCDKTNPNEINHKCSPIDEKRWWTSEDGDDLAGLCGKSAPLYKGYYPVCDPDDPGYSCCGPAGYCGTGKKYCDCPTCKNYGEFPEKILQNPIKPSVPVTWYFLNAPDGKRGRCGRKIAKIDGVFPTCNPDDENSYCCSNGGYCGNKDDHCKCNGCINFKTNKNYRFGPKKWWTLEDGKDKAGKCGPKAPKVDGVYEAECEPNTKFNCCSSSGYCGSGPEFCDCPRCKKFN